MPIVKMFEVRDRMTFIPVLAIQTVSKTPAESYLFNRAGYGEEQGLIIVVKLEEIEAHYSAYDWYKNGTRTMANAHEYIVDHFNELESGAVIDVEFILGEKDKPKHSEREDGY